MYSLPPYQLHNPRYAFRTHIGKGYAANSIAKTLAAAATSTPFMDCKKVSGVAECCKYYANEPECKALNRDKQLNNVIPPANLPLPGPVVTGADTDTTKEVTPYTPSTAPDTIAEGQSGLAGLFSPPGSYVLGGAIVAIVIFAILWKVL